MRTIRISSEVWDAIAERGKFGETPDDVLRRVFSIGPHAKRRLATEKLYTRIRNGELVLRFKHGPSQAFPLPAKSDKAAIRQVRDSAVGFAKQNAATVGQQASVMKKLTQAGYLIAR